MKKVMRCILTWITTISIILSISAPVYGVSVKTRSEFDFFKVEQVIDGDTIRGRLRGKLYKVRLIGIDTPETVAPGKPVQCFGKEATQKVNQLVRPYVARVKLVPDSLGADKDKYNRLLRYVYLEDGTFLNEYMVREGYAYAYSKFPFYFKDEFKKYQAEAKLGAKGLWSACHKLKPQTNKVEEITPSPAVSPVVSPTPVSLPASKPASAPAVQNQQTQVQPQPQQTEPQTQQCAIKGNISSTGERIYHVPGGSYYSRTEIDEGQGERWFCSGAEAEAAGWRKSLR